MGEPTMANLETSASENAVHLESPAVYVIGLTKRLCMLASGGTFRNVETLALGLLRTRIESNFAIVRFERSNRTGGVKIFARIRVKFDSIRNSSELTSREAFQPIRS